MNEHLHHGLVSCRDDERSRPGTGRAHGEESMTCPARLPGSWRRKSPSPAREKQREPTRPPTRGPASWTGTDRQLRYLIHHEHPRATLFPRVVCRGSQAISMFSTASPKRPAQVKHESPRLRSDKIGISTSRRHAVPGICEKQPDVASPDAGLGAGQPVNYP